MQLRQESFYEFIKKTKFPFFYTWPLNLGYVAILATFIYQGIKTNLTTAVIACFFVTTVFFGLKFFLYRMTYTIYRAGGLAIKELNGREIEFYENLGIYIRGFDLFDQKRFFPLVISKTIYDFDLADIVLTEKSLILMGRNNHFGGETYAYPVEITLGNQGLTGLPKAVLIDWQQKGKRVELQINDSQYKNPIKVDIKAYPEEILQLLSRL